MLIDYRVKDEKMSLLTLENICKDYSNQAVLKGVSLRIEKGERVGLIGPNGAGKTTLLRIAMGLETCDSGSIETARNINVGYLSQDLPDTGAAPEGNNNVLHYERIHLMEQRLRELEELMAESSPQADTPSYRRLMSEYSRLLSRYEALDGYTAEMKISKILLGLGLRRETLSVPLDKLSGGEKMRVSLARILLDEPDLLILDEPTNHLDIQAVEWLEGFLKRFEGGILFVSHDRYFLDRVATRIAELDGGSLCIRSGSYTGFQEYKKQLAQYVQNEQNRLNRTIRNTHEIIQGLKTQRKIKAIKSREKELKRLKELRSDLEAVNKSDHLHRPGRLKLEFKKIRHVSKDIAWADNLSKRFGNVTLFSKASFQIRGGDRVGIIGPNGCGKTTLVNMLLGNDQDYEGLLRLGEWVKYSYMGQEVLFENDNLTLLELILAKKDLAEREARDFLARFQFYGDLADKKIQVLSGGERVRLYLACVVLENADCLILDEPTNHLDIAARAAVENALREFKGTVIAITHDRYYLTNCVSKILEIENAKITTYSGNYEFYKQEKYGIVQGGQSKEEPVEQKSFRKNAVEKKPRKKAPDPDKERQDLEGEIYLLEAQVKEMERSFDKTTPPETYQEYDRLLQELELLYKGWEDLLDQN